MAGALAAWTASGAEFTPEQLEHFERRVRPVLVEHCYPCHSVEGGKQKGGLRLDTRDAARAGGETRPAIVPGQPAASLLMEATRYGNPSLQMPPDGRLPDAVIADLERWIADGAADPREEVSPSPAGVASTVAETPSAHWAFQPPREVVPPAVADVTWVKSPLDRFVLSRLEAAGLSPAPPADRRTWLRRVTFDLTGLPATPDEVAAFLADDSPESFARVVDRLLASPHYGERWARHWLDVARYADSNGQDENKAMANAWRYRDYVINAFNRDKPFDQFIHEQLAGDLLPPSPDERVNFERWTATGFLVLGPKMLAEQDKPKLEMDVVDEQIDTVSRAFLGLTVSCARCHDHKFDPVPARDYYALAGIFKSTKTMGDLSFVSKWNERAIATAEELARAKDFAAATNAAQAAVKKAAAGADAAVRQHWRSLAGAYLAAATELHRAHPAGPETNILAAAATERGLHAPTLQRWLDHLLRPSDPAMPSPLAPFLVDEEAARTFPDAVAAAQRSVSQRLPTMPQYAPGRFGHALRCGGENYLVEPHAIELEPAHLTFEAWVRPTNQGRDGETRRWIINKNPNEWADGHYALVINRDQAGAYLNIGGGATNVHEAWSASGAVPLNEWTHLACTFDGNVLTIYVNGRPAGSSLVGRGRTTGSGSLQIARREDGFTYFKGLIDEVRVYNRALTDAEVARRFSDPQVELSAGLLRHWSFDPQDDEGRRLLAQDQLHELLSSREGLLRPPLDERPFYTAEHLAEVEARERERDALLKAAPPALPVVLAVEKGKPVELPVHIRGSHLNLAPDPVPRGFIRVLHQPVPPPVPEAESGRLQLAQWLTHPEHPLTGRVLVNRVWQAMFGEGLVRTPDNFGLRGDAPTHPELLDWLARGFVRGGWSLKQLHRTIALSATYRMSAAFDARAAEADPDNRLLWRMNRRRLEAEQLRDALLAVSGQLDRTMGGTLVEWKNADYAPGDTVSAASRRRAVYLPVVRDRVYDVFTIFDFANPGTGASRRAATVVSHQALFFLNSPFVKEQARQLVLAVFAGADTDEERLGRIYGLALGRTPTAEEGARALAHVSRVAAMASPGAEADPHAARLAGWISFCQALLASSEFLYLD